MRSTIEELLTSAAPEALAILGPYGGVSYRHLRAAVRDAESELRSRKLQCIGLHAENGAAWIRADLACLAAEVTCVPLPDFFTDAQIRHVLSAAGVTAVLTDRPGRFEHVGTDVGVLGELTIVELRAAAPRASDAAKVSFTSGTTGAPKGVRVSGRSMLRVAQSLQEATGLEPGLHLSLLPLSVLLENIGGIYSSLRAGGCVYVDSVAQLGLRGSSELDIAQTAHALHAVQPTRTILVPQQLAALVNFYESTGEAPPTSLRFVAVGGAAVPRGLIQRARAVGLPAHEGYGLTETCSVVAVNTPSAEREGSVGRVLPHLQLETSSDGEILVRGTIADSYLDGPLDTRGGWIATGDLGHLDEDGFLFLHGRKTNRLITSFGRNVSPEWVERELEGAGAGRAVVFGNGEPELVAILSDWESEGAAERALASANARLPDYARVARWIPAQDRFEAGNGQLTPDGRLVRAAIELRHADALAQAFSASHSQRRRG